MKTLVIVPTYNERDNIQKLLTRVLAVNPAIHVLVVDDNSPDGTSAVVKEMAAGCDRINLLSRPGKMGLGPAYLAGFKWALERGFDVMIEMDADLSHRPRYLPKFIEAIQNSDVVAGSRWMKGGRIANWPFSRVLLSRTANLYAKFVLGVPVYDLTGGYTAYRRKVLETLNLDRIHSDGYSFQIEMKYRSLQHGFKVTEIPITFTDRRIGSSKISRRIVLEALIMVWRLKFSGIA